MSLLLLLLATVASTAPAQPSLTPDLARKVSQSSPDEYIPLLLILSDQADCQDLLLRFETLSKADRRQNAISELKDLAVATQAVLLRDLKELERAGAARNIQPLWFVNAISVWVKAQYIKNLIYLHAEINRGVWDPPQPYKSDTPRIVEVTDETGWGLLDIQAPQVWSLGYEGQGVVVGLISTGVDYNHSDLQSRIWVNSGEDLNVNGQVDPSDWNGEDDDDNGYIDDLRGWDFLFDTSEVMDGHYIGTQTAGIIAGDGSGGNVTGVAPQARLMVLKCFNDNSSASAYLQAQEYAVAMGADLIGNTMTFPWNLVPPPDYAVLRQACNAVLAAGIIQSNSIGFEGLYQFWDPVPFNIPLPAHCPPPWIHPSQTLQGGLSATLGTGAYDANHQRKDSSSVGPAAWNLPDILLENPSYPWASSWPDEYNDYPYQNGQYQGLIKPDLAAPTDVLTAYPGGLYSIANGTDPSSAHTAGTLALMLGAAPQATPATLARIIMTTAMDMGLPGKDNFWGAGRLNALAAMTLLLSEINGTLTGFVHDSSSGNVLDSVSVDLPDLQLWSMTDSLGHYFLSNIPAGSHDVRFARYGWDTLMVPGVNFQLGIAETLSVALVGPMMEIEPAQINVTLLPGDSSQIPVTVHNPGTAPLQVSLIRRGNWTFGSLYSMIQVQIISGDEKLFGVEVADSSVWVSGGNNNSEPNFIYRFAFNGLLLDTLTQPTSTSTWGWRDLAWDGQYLYGSSGPEIESLELNGNPGPTIPGPLSLNRALAYNPVTDHFFTGDGTSPLYEISRSGSIIRLWNPLLNLQGLAWQPNDEDGYPLYLFSQEGPGSLRVSKLNPNTGSVQFVLDLPGSPGEQAGGATISGDLDVNRWCFLGLVQAPLGGNDQVRIHSLGVYAPWLVVEPSGLQVVPPGGTLEAVVLLDASAAPEGSYLLNLVAQHNTPAPEVVIPVSLTISTIAVPPVITPSTPAEWGLRSVRPNPFNATTVASFELRVSSHVKLTVWDTAGRLVATLVDGWKTAGNHEVTFDGTGLGSGMYFVRMQAGEYQAVKKVVLLK
jgi:subtilisin family serine protease